MKQLPLLPIARQPGQPEPRIPSRVIQAYVRENLRDFARRQKERERTRKERQGKEPKRHARRKDDFMHTVAVTYRAIFEGPQGELNPLNLQIPGPCPVELYKAGKFWRLREIATRGRHQYERLQPLSSPDSAMDHIARCFARCIEPWQIWGVAPGYDLKQPKPPARLLLAHEFCDLGNGTVGWYTAEDFTHITRPGADYHPKEGAQAVCGAIVSHKKVISTKANKEPTCPTCVQIYRAEFA